MSVLKPRSKRECTKISSTKNVLLEAVSGLAATENESSQIDAEILFLFIFYIRVHFLHPELCVAAGKVHNIHAAVVVVRLRLENSRK